MRQEQGLNPSSHLTSAHSPDKTGYTFSTMCTTSVINAYPFYEANPGTNQWLIVRTGGNVTGNPSEKGVFAVCDIPHINVLHTIWERSVHQPHKACTIYKSGMQLTNLSASTPKHKCMMWYIYTLFLMMSEPAPWPLRTMPDT